MLKNCGHSMQWKELAVSRTLLGVTTGRANTFFMIVQRKVLKAAGVFATTVKRLSFKERTQTADNAIDMATAMGIKLLTEEQYRELQKLEGFDTKTSSWVQTPSHIRILGGALFCDRRYDTVFVFHNGAESYYAARAFRGSLRV
jgi:uncharacterized protein DUF4256